MKKFLLVTALAVFGVVLAVADPVIDGTITAGEYSQQSPFSTERGR